MAQAASSNRTRALWRRLRGVPLLVALAAAFNEAGINSVAAATAVTLAVPLAATAFVYEVQALRDAQLEREAIDRAGPVVADRAPPGREGVAGAPEPREADVGVKLDSMLASRSALLDTFGDDAATVAPVYTRIIKQMLKDDDATFALLRAKRENGGQALPVRDKEAALRAVHERLAHLAGS